MAKAKKTKTQATKKAPRKAAPGKAGTRKAATTGKAAAPKAAKPKGSAASKSGGSGPSAGDAAPAFTLPDDAGRQVSLSDYRGKKVVLYFYPKDMTGGCTREACDFRDHLSRLGSSGAVVLGVSADSVDSHRKFKEKQGLNFPLLSDPDHKALNAYGVWQEKSLYGRRFMGIVRSTFLIDAAGKVTKVFPKVRVEGHVDEVLDSL